MRGLLCAVVLVLIAPLHAAEPDSLATARKAIDDCTPRLDAQADVGYDRVAVRCPTLAGALERSGVEQWLPQGWKEIRNNLSVGSLRELRSLLDRELTAHASERKPRVEKLNDVLAGLGILFRVCFGTCLLFIRWLHKQKKQHNQEKHNNKNERMVRR